MSAPQLPGAPCSAAPTAHMDMHRRAVALIAMTLGRFPKLGLFYSFRSCEGRAFSKKRQQDQ
jgi:hypothetical protein